MVVSKRHDSVDLVLQLVLHDLLHYFLTALVDTSPRGFDVLLELEDLLLNHLEHLVDVLSEAIELGKGEVHDLVVGQDLEQLLIEVLDHGLQQQNSPVGWVTVLLLSDLPELGEDLLHCCSELVQVSSS